MVWFPGTACSNVIVQSSFIYLDPLRDGPGSRRVNVQDHRSLDINQLNGALVNSPCIIQLNYGFMSEAILLVLIADLRSK